MAQSTSPMAVDDRRHRAGESLGIGSRAGLAAVTDSRNRVRERLFHQWRGRTDGERYSRLVPEAGRRTLHRADWGRCALEFPCGDRLQALEGVSEEAEPLHPAGH